MRLPVDDRGSSPGEQSAARRTRYNPTTIIHAPAVPAELEEINVLGASLFALFVPTDTFDRDVVRVRIQYRKIVTGPATVTAYLWRDTDLVVIDSVSVDDGAGVTLCPPAPYSLDADEQLAVGFVSGAGISAGTSVYAEIVERTV